MVIASMAARAAARDVVRELQERVAELEAALTYAAETTNDKHTSRKAFEALGKESVGGGALSRAHRMGGDARAQTIAAWLRTLVDWNVSLERAAEWIEAGVYQREDGGLSEER